MTHLDSEHQTTIKVSFSTFSSFFTLRLPSFSRFFVYLQKNVKNRFKSFFVLKSKNFVLFQKKAMAKKHLFNFLLYLYVLFSQK